MYPSKFPSQFPKLETERLVLREISFKDRQALFHNYSDEENTRYVMEPLKQLKQASEIIRIFQKGYRNKQVIYWALSLKNDTTLIGSCGFDNIALGDHRAEIGYDLGKPHWGKGYMREAMQAVLNYGYG